MDQAIIEVQTGAGNWREVGRCSNNMQVISRRMDEAKMRNQNSRVRARDARTHSILDIN